MSVQIMRQAADYIPTGQVPVSIRRDVPVNLQSNIHRSPQTGEVAV